MIRGGEVILSLLRARYGGVGTVRVDDLPCAEWDLLARQACHWRVAPLLYDTLRSPEGRKAVPPGFLDALRESYLGWAAENTRTFHRLARILAILGERNIHAIVLKGAHLAGEVYGNIALRPMGDVDLLVKSADARNAQDALVASGYRPHQGGGFRHDSACSAHLPVLSRRGWPIVEIHWGLAAASKGLRPDPGGLWERARNARVGNEESPGLSPEDLLVHIGYHACAHGYADGPLFLCDVAEISTRWGGRIDWERAIRIAEGWGASKSFYLAARLAAECLGANVPLAEFERRRPKGLDEEVCLGLKARVLGEPHDISGILSRLGPKAKWGRVAAFGRSAARSAFLPREALSVMYGLPTGSRRCYLYYPVRWAELFLRHGVLRDRNRHASGIVADIDRSMRG